MNTNEFKQHTERCLESLPPNVRGTNLSTNDRGFEALVHLNTSLHPHLKNDVGTLIDILLMKDGPEKLRLVMLWGIAISQTSPDDMREIIKLMDEYINSAVS